MACPHCGSWAVRSDRALAGRMVCARCGQPLGGAAGSQGRGLRRKIGSGLNRGQRLGLVVLALLGISAVLASLDQRGARELHPPAWEGGSHWSR